ncbi:MAG: hypothetical protein HKN89_02290 [Eudoraea sp.]|nr:hypothetical protein [Eudoraea sp.]
MHLNRSQLSIIITFFSLSTLVLSLYNMHLGSEEKEEYAIEMMMLDEEIEELLEQEKKMEELANAEALKTHMALNQTAKPNFKNPEPLKSLEELMAEKNLEAPSSSDEASDNGEYEANLKELAEKREKARQELEEKEAQKEEYTQNLAERRTSIAFSLVDRQGYHLPPPIYTCIEGGMIVINITVDNRGFVSEASYNSASSNTTNGCLIDNAITYAYKARFSPADKSSQIGTITYIFQGK